MNEFKTLDIKKTDGFDTLLAALREGWLIASWHDLGDNLIYILGREAPK